MRLSIQFQTAINKAMRIMPLLLLACLTSCANKPQIITYPTIPAAYLAHLDKTSFSGSTYGDVAQYAVILKRERDVCLNRIDKIREWQREKMEK
ncbi:Rz1-like lysis system protein LysC [Haemophilus influenzae]|uniref:Rz1-like lysis system protein LysC n=1 Tax=Haemophilus influenzae TaxID=727 RepID=UPI001C3385F5|nr:hypothetical protein CHBNIV1_14440 [Haemophilus influenzae]